MRDNKWHYVGFIRNYNVDTIKIYIDGLDNNFTTAGTNLDLQWPLRIGGDFAASPVRIPFNGLIDDVRIYNQAISTSEIQNNYFIGINKLLKDQGITLNEFNQRLVELKNNIAKQ